MIKVERKVSVATCDSCGKSLIQGDNINYGKLESSFGYGSRFDDLGDWVGSPLHYEICDDCWEKALKGINLAPCKQY